MGARIGMLLEAWPDTDRDLWARTFEPRLLLEATESGAALAHNTRRCLTTSYATWLRWLTDQHLDRLACPAAERATPEAILAYIAFIEARLSLSSVGLHLRTLGRRSR